MQSDIVLPDSRALLPHRVVTFHPEYREILSQQICNTHTIVRALHAKHWDCLLSTFRQSAPAKVGGNRVFRTHVGLLEQ